MTYIIHAELSLEGFTRKHIKVWLNLIVVMSLQYPRQLSYTIILPSVHEFVTASSISTDSIENDTVTAYNTVDKVLSLCKSFVFVHSTCIEWIEAHLDLSVFAFVLKYHDKR